ncbi:hypothetical protein BCR41DRAFT_399834 [Lobosporangium transversale]|uniref:Uncharacterized protein n=1 Tax=Lobosporangium transversale TaxID=64571 RepID=A0A1Y2GGJ9_9FUNG|nr:hypothetical protein BCR41DRAFT_399834 [Lobosporangium transversale]ORZ06975.1 hypothetical protein BCR41DRAFT_399834 [Lobosporangium transversale]|eukprot:XP_021877771.1 hypothetical protein BCR41DRAFT_399834 [Lobosporangium transversale]
MQDVFTTWMSHSTGIVPVLTLKRSRVPKRCQVYRFFGLTSDGIKKASAGGYFYHPPDMKSLSVSLDLPMKPRCIGASDFQILVNSLKTNTTLVSLDLEPNLIGNEGVLALSEALKDNSIGRKGALALSETLRANTALTTLRLKNNLIGNEGALAMSEALKTKTNLTTLRLRSNSIRKESTLALSEAFKPNAALNEEGLAR